MNPDAASPACTLCKRPMSPAEAGSGRLCSQCQSIVKNILPTNDGRLTTTPLRPEVAEAAAKIQAPIPTPAPQQAQAQPQTSQPAQAYDNPWPEDDEQNGSLESGLSESKLTFDESHFAADEPPIKFETGPLEQPAAGYR